MRWSLLLLVLLVSACEPEQPATGPAVRVDQAMGAQAAPGFARAYQPRAFEFPQDYGAHPDYATEWWYLTGNLRSESGRRFGYQVTLFRVGLRPGEPAQDSAWRTNQIYMGHIAISDIDGNRHVSAERFARAAAGLAGATAAPFDVWLDDWSLRGGAGLFPLTVAAQTAHGGVGAFPSAAADRRSTGTGEHPPVANLDLLLQHIVELRRLDPLPLPRGQPEQRIGPRFQRRDLQV